MQPKTIAKKSKSKFFCIPASKWRELCTVVEVYKDADGNVVQEGGTADPYETMYLENEFTDAIRKQGGIFINDAFVPLWDSKDRMNFFDGTWGSSKTTFVITRLLRKAIENKYFRCIYGRDTIENVRKLHSNIITEIDRNNWRHLFSFSEDPKGHLIITCKENKNSFLQFSIDTNEPDKQKGWDNITDVLFDEINQCDFANFMMLYTRLRRPGTLTQFWGCFNNEAVFPGHWLLTYIYGNEVPADEKEANILSALRKIGIFKHHSTFYENLFMNPKAYEQGLWLKAGGDQDKFDAICRGDWGVDLSAQPYAKMFSKDRVVKPAKYSELLPLNVSFDENRNPFFPCLIIQKAIVGSRKIIRIVNEICGKHPNNTLDWVCADVVRQYGHHKLGGGIYGDATSDKEDVKLETGTTFFTMAYDRLKDLKLHICVPDENPNNGDRQDFLNAIFALNYGGLEIEIDPCCKNLIKDLIYYQEDIKEKARGKDKTPKMIDGKKGVQPWGHLIDAMEYYICKEFAYEYTQYRKGIRDFGIKVGQRTVTNTFAEAKEVKEVITPIVRRTGRRISKNLW